MPRTDNDSWDITQSVGATALGVAAARAAETESENPLINDPFARVFVDAAGDGHVEPLRRSRAVGQGGRDSSPMCVRGSRLMIDFMATRTAFFDEFFLGAADAGVRQVVILASGLDARSWRLPWPDGTVVYELDQPKVLDFKTSTLREHGAAPDGAELVTIPIDLRQDWPKALQEAGFDAVETERLVRRGVGAVPAGARPRICCSSACIRSARRAAGWLPMCPARIYRPRPGTAPA